MKGQGMNRQEIAKMIVEANQKLLSMLDDVRSETKSDQKLLSKIEMLCGEYRTVGFFEGQLHLIDFISDAGNLTPNVQPDEDKPDHPPKTEEKDGGHHKNRQYF